MTSRKKKPTGKQIDFSVRPRAVKELPASAEQWVQEGKRADTPPPAEEGPQKRLTLNLSEELHKAFKGRCVLEGITIQDKVRLLIERELTAPGEGASHAADKPTGT